MTVSIVACPRRAYRRKDPAVDVPADRTFQNTRGVTKPREKDLRGEETLTTAIRAMMQGMTRLVPEYGVQDVPEALVEDSLELLAESTARDTIDRYVTEAVQESRLQAFGVRP